MLDTAATEVSSVSCDAAFTQLWLSWQSPQPPKLRVTPRHEEVPSGFVHQAAFLEWEGISVTAL